MIEVYVNSIIGYRDPSDDMRVCDKYRVLWIAADNYQVVIINLSGQTMPEVRDLSDLQQEFTSGLALKLTDDPFSKLVNPPEEFLAKHKHIRDSAWDIIKDLVSNEPDIYRPDKRGLLIMDKAKELGKHKRVIYRHIKNFWTKGKIANALLPEFDKCGGRGKTKHATEGVKLGRPPKVCIEDPQLIGVNVTDADKKMINIALKIYYKTKEQNTLAYTYTMMVERQYGVGIYTKNGVPVPIQSDAHSVISFVQFRYWAHKLLEDPKHSYIERYGERNWALTRRPLLGDSTTRTQGPGSLWEMDAAVGDVYLVSTFDRSRIIGRPVVYSVKDVSTRLIAGLYVGLEGPSWLGAMMALENAFADKTEYCAGYGITIEDWEWPSRHLPKSITADRGEMEGFNADALVHGLNIRVDNTPPYRADLKGVIEQNFRCLNLKVGPFTPGWLRKELRERGEPDDRLRARLTVEEFTKIMIAAILLHNKQELKNFPLTREMTMDAVPPIPVDLWSWGVAHYGHLQERPRDAVRLNLMPREKASVTRQGISFKTLYYTADELLQAGWYDKAASKRYKVIVSYDPRLCDYIYIHDDEGGFIKCRLLERYARFRGLRFEEVQDQLFFEEVESQRRLTDQRQWAAESHALMEDTAAKGSALTEDALDPSESKNSRLKHIQDNRKKERDQRRDREQWEVRKEEEQSGATVAEVIPLHTGDGSPKVESNSIMEILKQQREKRGKN